jgi:hypothetical protein
MIEGELQVEKLYLFLGSETKSKEWKVVARPSGVATLSI